MTKKHYVFIVAFVTIITVAWFTGKAFGAVPVTTCQWPNTCSLQ